MLNTFTSECFYRRSNNLTPGNATKYSREIRGNNDTAYVNGARLTKAIIHYPYFTYPIAIDSGITMFKKIIFTISLITLSTQIQARGVDIKLANKMAEFTYLTESSTFGYGGADIGAGVLFNENNDYQANAKVMVSGNPAGNNKSIQFGVGGKIVYANLKNSNEDVGALAIAGQFRYVIPAATPIAFVAGVAYAPSITAFSSAENFIEYSAAAELEVTPSARAYLAFRTTEYEITGGTKVKLDDGLHLGIKFEF